MTLPKPPALNHLYGTNKWGGKYLKSDGVVWKESAMWILKTKKTESWDCPLALEVHLYTCRHQDNDGVLKLLQDTLQGAGVYKDDYWIFDLHVIKHKCQKSEERIELEIKKLDDQTL